MIVFINSHGNLTKTNAGFANNRNFKKGGGGGVQLNFSFKSNAFSLKK